MAAEARDRTAISGDPSAHAAPRRPGPRARRSLSSVQLALIVALIGLQATAMSSWAAWTLNRRNEHSLLKVQTRQAAAVLSASILDISSPLAASLQIARATHGDVDQFRQSLARVTGPGLSFASAGLLDASGPSPRVVASIGATPELAPQSRQAADFVRLAQSSRTFVVTSPSTTRVDRVAYAVADPADPRFVVYAERAIPANRLVPVESNPAFTDLDFATYLGPTPTMATLATTDVPLSQLPLSGDTVQESIAFGNTSLTLVASTHVQLGGQLGRRLPWVFGVGGGLLTGVSVATAATLASRRRHAEQDSQIIADLYARVDTLLAEQRTIAGTLQQALLPRTNPSIAGLEIASRYVAGAHGVDIGGDWFSIMPVDETRFGFVVGDVSGRGISAATIMARLRFTMRAYLLEGHPPDVVLEMCSHQIDFADDGHFATALVGLADLGSREVVLANAGHLEPLLVQGSRAEYVATTVGPPLGVELSRYPSTRVAMAPGSMLLAFTDGLVERRSESIDVGLDRLARAAGGPPQGHPADLDDLVTTLVQELTDADSEDDVAVLAFRWRTPQ